MWRQVTVASQRRLSLSGAAELQDQSHLAANVQILDDARLPSLAPANMSQPCFQTHRTINIATYPEDDPWKADPPIYNIPPYTADGDTMFDTPELRAAAWKIAQRTGVNVYGQTVWHESVCSA